MQAVEEYLRQIYEIRVSGAGVNETSYYGALEKLFNAVGQGLKPKVTFILNLRNKGAGIPDGGFFTATQLRKSSDIDWQSGQLPERGAVEVKGAGDDVDRIAGSAQVAKYLERYGLVLVTNLRDFLLVGRDEQGKTVKLERYTLGADEKAFWPALAASQRKMAAEHGGPFVEYLKRVMLYKAPLSSPVDLAWFLASYAKDAGGRVERAAAAGATALQHVRTSLENALGLTFQGAKGEHFFRSTLVQTLFYGMFSAWVLWSKKRSPAGQEWFDWKDAGWELQVPVIRSLFETLATRTKLDPLGLVEVMEWAGATLNRVNRAEFFSKFEEEHAVQYFYEPFLEAFDPDLRKELGVWYTPPEIVTYMVERVDRVLREELHIADGLADERVTVLDPACGTGAYLVEALRRVARTLEEKGEDALLGHRVKTAAIGRVFGFEILPAPFVVAHLQLGLFLQNLGAPLSEKKHERASVYLTNSLTGWETGQNQPQQIVLEGLEEEREAAHAVKRADEILVVIGNPPYNAFAGTSPKEEQGLVEPYKEGLISEWGIKKFNLDDLYIRFFRLAERRITEMNRNGAGVVCYISNFSYLRDPSYVVMRRRFLSEFDALWFDSLNGDSRETGKVTPDGKPDPSVFSTKYNREGIRVGTAIGLMVRKTKRAERPQVMFREFWGVAKREELIESLTKSDFENQYAVADPKRNNRYALRPLDISLEYLGWPALIELASQQPFAGMAEDRRKSLIGIDRAAIRKRMQMYFDPKVDWRTLDALGTFLTRDLPRFDAKKTRGVLLQTESYREDRLLRFLMRPFDLQWCYYSPVRPLWREPRPEYWASYQVGTPALITRFKSSKLTEGPPIAFTRSLSDYHAMPPNSSIIPVLVRHIPREGGAQAALFADAPMHRANLSERSREYLHSLGIVGPDDNVERASLIWMHALATGYTPDYLEENADGIRQDWPRIPLPSTLDLLQRSAKLGQEIAALLDTERPVAGVTTGRLRPEMKAIGSPRRENGGQLRPDEGDLQLTAGWGYAGQQGVTMPGKGKTVERPYTAEERAAIEAGALALGLSLEQALRHLGETTFDVYLNNAAYWKNVPKKVWQYTIGGYQVMKKWLSYRELGVLGRGLTVEEAVEVGDMARRLAGIVLLEPALNESYEAIKVNTYDWRREDQ